MSWVREHKRLLNKFFNLSRVQKEVNAEVRNVKKLLKEHDKELLELFTK